MSEKKTAVEEQYDKLYEEMESATAQKGRSKPERTMEELLGGMDSSRKRKKDGNELLRFFGGLLLFGAGLFMVFQNLTVSSTLGSYGPIFRLGGYGIPNGTIMIPLLIGIALLFLCDRKLWGWLFIAVGIVIVIAAVIMSVSIQWRTSNAWFFIVSLGMIFAGGAMMVRELFRSE